MRVDRLAERRRDVQVAEGVGEVVALAQRAAERADATARRLGVVDDERRAVEVGRRRRLVLRALQDRVPAYMGPEDPTLSSDVFGEADQVPPTGPSSAQS